MNIASILRQKGGGVISVTPETALADIASIISNRKIGAVVVLDADQKLAGIVSERDIVRAVSERGAGIVDMTAADVMTRAVKTATPATTVDEAMEMMDAGYFRHLPVVDNGALIGIVSVRDAVRGHIQEQTHEVDSLKSYVFRGAQAGGLR